KGGCGITVVASTGLEDGQPRRRARARRSQGDAILVEVAGGAERPGAAAALALEMEAEGAQQRVVGGELKAALGGLVAVAALEARPPFRRPLRGHLGAIALPLEDGGLALAVDDDLGVVVDAEDARHHAAAV